MTGYVNDTAFPTGSEQTQGQFAPSLGVSVLEYFAAAALSGILADAARDVDMRTAACLAYEAAEEMMLVSRPYITLQQEEQNETVYI